MNQSESAVSAQLTEAVGLPFGDICVKQESVDQFTTTVFPEGIGGPFIGNTESLIHQVKRAIELSLVRNNKIV